MVFYRSVVALTLPVPNMLLTRPRSLLRPRRIGIHIVRAIIGNLGMAYVFWAHALLPMADATALLFASPLFVAALSPPLIGEKVDGSRWVVVVTGFAGIFLITRPSPALVAHPAVLVGLAAVLADITLRKLGRTDAPLTTVYFLSLE